MRRIRTAQRWLAVVILAAVAAQFLLAGAGAFHATSFKPGPVAAAEGAGQP